MCVIINIHHDNLTEAQLENNPGFAISTDTAKQAKSKAFIKSVWKQVADYFKDYDNRLVFELLNEPRCMGTAWEWGFWDQQHQNKKAIYCDIITDYEQAALNVIRASGGKNKTRYIMCPSYACSGDFYDVYKLPEDAADVKDRLIYAVHAYSPSEFCLEGKKTVYDSGIENAIDWTFSQLKSKITKEKIGIVMGEASASDKDNYNSRIKWAKRYFEKAVDAGVPVILWDNEQAVAMGAKAGGECHGYFNRKTCKVTWPEMFEVMMKAVYGKDIIPE